MKINKTQGYQIIQNWMNEKGQKPFFFQEETWSLYAQNFSGLVVAPTGFGKTFSVFLAVIHSFLNHPEKVRTSRDLSENPGFSNNIKGESRSDERFLKVGIYSNKQDK